MSNAKQDNTLLTTQDVEDYLRGLLWKHRQIENDFDIGYDRALNDVMYVLKYAALPEATMKNVLDYLISVRQDIKNRPPENEYERGYERAINDLIYQVRAASPELENALNARDDNRETRITNEDIEAAIQKLIADGEIYDTGKRSWSEQTQSYEALWAFAPPKHKQH
jgi:hypothetical protein